MPQTAAIAAKVTTQPRAPQTVGAFVMFCAKNYQTCTSEIAADETVLALSHESGTQLCEVPRGVDDNSADQQILTWLGQHSELSKLSTLNGVKAAISGVWNCVAEISNGVTYNGAPENTSAFLTFCSDTAHAAVCEDVIVTASMRAYAASLGFKNGSRGHCTIPDAVKSGDALAKVSTWLAGRNDVQSEDIEDSAPRAIDALWPCQAAAPQQSFVDTPPGQQEIWQNYTVHVCPPGYAMAGAHVINNQFTCLRVVASGNEGQIHSILDTGTQAEFGRGNMHVCPQGTYMRGLHAINNWLICSDGATLGTPFLDAAGATQGNGMHMCPVVNGRQTAMTGIDDPRNDFACAQP